MVRGEVFYDLRSNAVSTVRYLIAEEDVHGCAGRPISTKSVRGIIRVTRVISY